MSQQEMKDRCFLLAHDYFYTVPVNAQLLLFDNVVPHAGSECAHSSKEFRIALFDMFKFTDKNSSIAKQSSHRRVDPSQQYFIWSYFRDASRDPEHDVDLGNCLLEHEQAFDPLARENTNAEGKKSKTQLSAALEAARNRDA
jgi:hypothetical protein